MQVILGLLALLLTFDALSGERESGNLRLLLGNGLPRRTLLAGKLLGALAGPDHPMAAERLGQLLADHLPRWDRPTGRPPLAAVGSFRCLPRLSSS